MSDIVAGDFNYGSVDVETAAKLEYFAKTGKAIYRKHQIQFIADFGKLLSEARELLANNKNGTFIKWATAEFDIDKSSVYRYLNAWDRILSHGETTYLHWSPTALYLASADDFPKPVMKKLEKIPATDLVRTSDVKRLIEASKPKPVPVVKPEEYLDLEQTQTDVLDTDGDYDADQVEDDPSPVFVPEQSQASIMLDSLGKQIPKNLRSASELAIQINAIGRDVDKFRKLAKELAEQPGGEWLRMQDIDAAVRNLKSLFHQAAYYTACPKCGGKGIGCQKCESTGWIPEWRKNQI
jgi:hypothetical protein